MKRHLTGRLSCHLSAAEALPGQLPPIDLKRWCTLMNVDASAHYMRIHIQGSLLIDWFVVSRFGGGGIPTTGEAGAAAGAAAGTAEPQQRVGFDQRAALWPLPTDPRGQKVRASTSVQRLTGETRGSLLHFPIRSDWIDPWTSDQVWIGADVRRWLEFGIQWLGINLDLINLWFHFAVGIVGWASGGHQKGTGRSPPESHRNGKGSLRISFFFYFFFFGGRGRGEGWEKGRKCFDLILDWLRISIIHQRRKEREVTLWFPMAI